MRSTRAAPLPRRWPTCGLLALPTERAAPHQPITAPYCRFLGIFSQQELLPEFLTPSRIGRQLLVPGIRTEQRIGGTQRVGAGTGPRVVPRQGLQPGLDRIALDI